MAHHIPTPSILCFRISYGPSETQASLWIGRHGRKPDTFIPNKLLRWFWCTEVWSFIILLEIHSKPSSKDSGTGLCPLLKGHLSCLKVSSLYFAGKETSLESLSDMLKVKQLRSNITEAQTLPFCSKLPLSYPSPSPSFPFLALPHLIHLTFTCV